MNRLWETSKTLEALCNGRFNEALTSFFLAIPSQPGDVVTTRDIRILLRSHLAFANAGDLVSGCTGVPPCM